MDVGKVFGASKTFLWREKWSVFRGGETYGYVFSPTEIELIKI
jgi:hypothetical protein